MQGAGQIAEATAAMAAQARRFLCSPNKVTSVVAPAVGVGAPGWV